MQSKNVDLSKSIDIDIDASKDINEFIMSREGHPASQPRFLVIWDILNIYHSRNFRILIYIFLLVKPRNWMIDKGHISRTSKNNFAFNLFARLKAPRNETREGDDTIIASAL